VTYADVSTGGSNYRTRAYSQMSFAAKGTCPSEISVKNNVLKIK
jgi:hypothetical protein